MASAGDKNYEAALSLAKATAKYRSLLEPVKRAVYLHAEHGIPQRRAANEEGVSRASLRRALDAEAANREVGMNGRPRFLSVSQEKKLKDEILQRSSGLDAMCHREILEAVRTLHRNIEAIKYYICAYFSTINQIKTGSIFEKSK